MAKDPAFLFYPNDFLSGTYTMEDEQIGRYIKLLCLQHQKGHLSEKDMLKICLTYDEDIFNKFKIDKDGLYFNKRLDDESNRRKAYSKSRSDNRKGKKKDMNNTSKTYVPHMETETITEDITEDINTLWQRTFGRNPNIPEYEETIKFIESYGEETAYQTYKAAALRNIKSISYLMANIDEKGVLMSYEEKNKNKEEIREIK